MPNNLTDAEIKKALETLLELVLLEGCLQRAKTISLSLDLINRQSSRIEKLEKVERYADKTITALQAENENLKKKNSNLTSNLTSLQNNLTSAKAEIERLSNHIQEGIDLAKKIPELILLAKIEAYKEFAERLKDKYKNYIIISMDKINNGVDNLLNELVGDEK